MSGGWRVELTVGAVEALRALPRAERAVVTSRIDDLASSGVPPALRTAAGEAVVVPVGDVVLFCLEDVEARTVVLLAVRSASALAEPSLSGVVGGWRSVLRGRGGSWLMRDIRYAVRSLRRSPGFALAAILTLALGIGSAAAIFSVANGVLLRPLPYADADRVVTLWTSWDDFADKTWVSIPEYQLLHQENRTLEDLALYGTSSVTFTSVDNPERVNLAGVTPNLFEVLGVSPVIGRVFTWDEAQVEPAIGVLLSWEVWRRRYGGDPSIIGTLVELDGTPTQVLGVLPEGFVLPTDFASSSVTDVYYPLFVDLESPAPDLNGGGSHGFYGVGRLRAGVTVAEASSDFDRVMAQVEPIGLYSPERRFTTRLFAVADDIVGSARTTILMLLGAVGFVLLIACGNVANLLLSRSEDRTGEVAVRASLGASRGRILRQLLTENVVLAGIAGVIGYGLAFAGVRVLLSIDPNAVPRAGGVTLDRPVMLVTVALSLLTALVFGAVPALRMSRVSLGGRLREGSRTGRRSAGSSRLQGVLVAAQMAMAVILLTGSVLMMRTFVSLLRIDPGFGAEDVLTVRITASSGNHPDAASVDLFYSEVLRRIRALPGVRSAGATRLLPLASTIGNSRLRPVGYQPGPNESTSGDWQWVTPGHLETIGIPLLEGRLFDERDRRGGDPVVIVNEVVARRYFGNGSAIGRQMLASGAPDTATIVGVVGNVNHNGITAQAKTGYYLPHAQVDADWLGTMRSMTLTIATQGPPLRLLEPVRREIRAVDPSVALSEIRTLDDVLSASVAQPRFAMVLLGSFAAVALALALVGIYSVLAYSVSRRTQEIGIRMALGAESGQVIGLVVRQGMTMALAGVMAGTGAAWLMSDLVAGLLYGVVPQDPATFVSVPVLFAAVAVIACLIPAARAARVRPASALRYE